jgi:hypothetical protein
MHCGVKLAYPVALTNSMITRTRSPKVTQSDLDRLVTLAKSLGLKIAEVEATPGRVRLITDAGRNLAVANDHEGLDPELADFRARHGYGTT